MLYNADCIYRPSLRANMINKRASTQEKIIGNVGGGLTPRRELVQSPHTGLEGLLRPGILS